MRIGGTNGVNGPQRIYPKPAETTSAAAAGEVVSQGDTVEISDAARLREAMARLPDIRADKVASAKEKIANGTLDTPENMDIALNRMMEDLLGPAEV